MSQAARTPPSSAKRDTARSSPAGPSVAPAASPPWDRAAQERSEVSAHLQDHLENDLDYQKVFLERRNALLGLITGTRGILYDLQKRRGGPFGVVQYPLASARNLGNGSSQRGDVKANGSTADLNGDRPVDVGRSGSGVVVDGVREPTSPRTPLEERGRGTPFSNRKRTSSVGSDSQRSYTSGRRAAQAAEEDGSLKVLRLGVKSAATRGNSNFMEAIEAKTAANLLQDKIADTLVYLEKLYNRTQDTSSKVLVTGDLNAGKSTFVNAVLRREVVPTDQQPCTAAFCEVVDAAQNDDIEEVHAIEDPTFYDRSDSHTFTRYDLRNLKDVVAENDDGVPQNDFELFRVYCHDKRDAKESLLKNGLVDISLIDSPGLNIDSMKTMSLFAQQEEIDVIIFMVHAENQFTLSGKEFLQTAGNEKGYIFVVVNRFDMIEKKERCRRDILEQIRRLSPRTYADASNLVHFVSAKNCLKESRETGRTPDDFANLERCLRGFILEKRLTSKLAPAKVYLRNLLNDLNEVAIYNHSLIESKYQDIASKIAAEAPTYKHLIDVKETVFDDIDKIIDSTSTLVKSHTRDTLLRFLDDIEYHAQEPAWRGFLSALYYAKDVRNHLYRLAMERVRSSERFGRFKTDECLNHVRERTKDCLAPPNGATNAVNVSQVWMEGMDIVAPGNDTTAPGPKKEHKEVSLEFGDFLDFQDRWEVAMGYLPGLGMVATGLVGYRSFAEGMFRMTGQIGVRNLSRLAFFGVALAGVGFFAFAVSDMRHVLSRKIARKVRKHLEDTEWAQFQVERLGRNVHRTLRLSIWDIQNRFFRRLEDAKNTRKTLEDERLEVDSAKSFWDDLGRRVSSSVEAVEEVDIES
ncbi:P-loop containing nucleoside triphosphate hydrolase protein [Gonapodya prolifera JEL478]|uniref:p-loop containing nucleoside triphosphate hydrolase protein n=1 Tax=Gonapodya prolifera (strain JEL478) TaxID=1344416 RepID=A0A139ALB2_GONPJ|nr:P-loop containing nucleoside triphosphate hydrolase protein [Gonapodya prolifera JEL478]|eukprot:KXS17577.1 P-loop containing nucleoside triphosphate hydrolase protein [Gonapodya prolifera JEL478]